MVRPIGIQHSDFCFCGIATFLAEIRLQESEICHIHSKSRCFIKFLQGSCIHINEIFYLRNGGWLGNTHGKTFRQLLRSQTRIYGINKIILDFFYISKTNFSTENYKLCTTYLSTFCRSVFQASLQQGKTLLGRVRTLVVLAGKIFPNNDLISFLQVQMSKAKEITLRLAKNTSSCQLGHVRIQMVNIVSVQIADTGNTRNPQEPSQLTADSLRLILKARLSLYINTEHFTIVRVMEKKFNKKVLEHHPGRLNPQPHPNSLIYNDGSANSPPSPYTSLAFRGRRWQAPIGSPSTLADDCWWGFNFTVYCSWGW